MIGADAQSDSEDMSLHLRNRAEIHLHLGSLSKAREDASRAAGLKDLRIELVLSNKLVQSAVYFAEGDPAEGRRILAEVKTSKARPTNGYEVVCWVLAHMGPIADARENCERGLNWPSNNGEILPSLGYVYWQLGLTNLAGETFDRAVTDFPFYGESQYYRAAFRRSLGDRKAT